MGRPLKITRKPAPMPRKNRWTPRRIIRPFEARGMGGAVFGAGADPRGGGYDDAVIAFPAPALQRP